MTYREPPPYKALRRALNKANLYRIEKDTGIPRATVRRIREGKGDVYFRTAATLMEYLGLEVRKKR